MLLTPKDFGTRHGDAATTRIRVLLQRLPVYLIELALLDVDFGFGGRQRLSGLEREAGQCKLGSRDGVEDADSSTPDEHVDQRVLEQRGEDEHEADGHPDVDTPRSTPTAVVVSSRPVL